MQETFQVIGTILMIIVLAYAIFKNINITMAMLSVGTVAVLILTYVTGESMMGENTTGSLLFDCFEFVVDTAKSTVSGQGLIVMSVMGYVDYMKSLKATEAFTLTLAKPFQKSKLKFAPVAGTVIITFLLQLVVTSNAGKASLALAILYPVMLASGASTATAATAIVLGQAFTYGPGCGMTYTVFSAGNIDYSVPQFFLTKELPIFIPSLIVTIVVFYFTSRYFDRKEQVSYDSSAATMSFETLGIPRWYAVLPIIPLVFIILFSGLFFSETISVAAANFMGLFIVLIIMLLTCKDKRAVFDNTKHFFQGMAESFGAVVTVMFAATLFANAISNVGGLTVIFSAFANAGIGIKPITIIGSLLAFAFITVSGSQPGNMALFGGLFGDIARSSGANAIDMCSTLLPVGCYSMAVSPVAGSNIMVSRITGVSITQIVKRTAIPACCTVLTMIIISQFILV